MSRPTGQPFRVHRDAVTTATPARRPPADYADQFEVSLDSPDAHTAEQWARTALEEAPPLIRAVIRTAHSRVLRFGLAPAGSAGHVFGWQVERAEPDEIVLATSGPLASAVLIGRRVAPTAMRLTTFAWFERGTARYVWWAVGPLHRRIAPYLLARAATTFARTAPVGQESGS